MVMNANQGPFVHSMGPESLVVWRRTDWGQEVAGRPIVVAKDNGTTAFGRIVGGTVLGKITASGKYRPCFKGTVNGNQPGVNEILLVAGQAANAYVGDAVKVIRPSTGATVYSGKALTVVNKTTHKVTIGGAAIDVLDGDLVMLEDGAQTAKRILDNTITTTYLNRATGELASEDVSPVKAWPVADVKSTSYLVGWNAYVAADLPNIIVE
jgi:hypothetical protein